MDKNPHNNFFYYSIFLSITTFSFSTILFITLIESSFKLSAILVFSLLLLMSSFLTYFFFKNLKSDFITKEVERAFELVKGFKKVTIFVNKGKIYFVNREGEKFFDRYLGKNFNTLRDFILEISNEERYGILLKKIEDLPPNKIYSLDWNISTNKIIQMEIRKINSDEFVLIFDVKDMFKTTETTLKIYEEITKNIFKKMYGYCWSGILNEDFSVNTILVVGNISGVTGYSKNEFLKMGEEILPDEDKNLRRLNFKKLMTEDVVENKFRIFTKSGDIKWIQEMVIPQRDGNGEISYVLGIDFDITKEKLEKDRIEARKKFLEKVFENIVDLLIITTDFGEIVYLNESARSLLSKESPVILGNPIFEIISKLNVEVGEKIKNIIEEKKYLISDIRENLSFKIDDEDKFFEIKVMGFTDENGNEMIIFLLIDITEEILKKELFERIAKLESLSLFAGGIAHNFNNLLFKIKGSLSLLDKYIKDKKGKEVISRLEEVIYEGEIMSNKLLSFAKGSGCVKKVVDGHEIERMMKKAIEKIKVDFSNDIQLTFSTYNFKIKCDTNQFYQAIYNILLNACEASQKNGKIFLKYEVLNRENTLKILIEDFGVGIPEKDIEKLFLPYFTTKEGHPGLGLSISQRIISNHEGNIFIKRKIKGTICEISLPIQNEDSSFDREPLKIPGDKEIKALVMDDDKMVREVFKDMLEELNCKVDLAVNGESAIEMYKNSFKKGMPYDVVFLDLMIENGLGGKETLKKLKEIDPDVKAIISSGYSDEDIIGNFKKFDFFDVLKKPFDLNDLSKIIKKIGKEE